MAKRHGSPFPVPRSPFPIPRSPFFVATLNVDFVSNAVSGWPFGGNDELWGYLRNADLVTADGMPIVVLSKLMRQPLPERVTGADMVPAICRRCAEEGLSVYVLGGDKDAVAEAFERLSPTPPLTNSPTPPLSTLNFPNASSTASLSPPRT